MAEPKTKKNNASVTAFLDTIMPEQKRKDCYEILKIFKEITKKKPTMWGTSIIGFGIYHYKSERSRQEGDWPRAAFSPRKQSITIYLSSDFSSYHQLLSKLGKHKTSLACLYIQRLSGIDVDILKELIRLSLERMEELYPTT